MSRIERPENFDLGSQPDYFFKRKTELRRCHFPRARGKGILGQIGKWAIYKPACWLHEHSPKGEAYLNSRLKRTIDIIGLIPLSCIGGPIVALEAAYVAFKDKTWPFYSLQCVGKNGEVFGRLKIKTMIDGADKIPGYGVPMIRKSPNDPRVRHRRLRNTSLDELPQIRNVLRGEMSIVGPTGRPKSEINYFKKVPNWDQNLKGRVERYLSLCPNARPGMTGLQQIMGRANLTLPETVLLEAWYLENASWVVDFSIIWGTLLAVKSGRGAF